MRWVEWVEPFGPNSEPVYMRCTEATVIAKMKYLYPDLTDERALEEFLVVNWARIVEPYVFSTAEFITDVEPVMHRLEEEIRKALNGTSTGVVRVFTEVGGGATIEG